MVNCGMKELDPAILMGPFQPGVFCGSLVPSPVNSSVGLKNAVEVYASQMLMENEKKRRWEKKKERKKDDFLYFS